ncbi:uncharacterized protein LOC134225149 isoform X2 [Armigeres subalbatus]|uniref:uncharacterized protein LOC134225149 isoform X2 n=1 Tax=Armigeres subalbatus TaxID=124917 RepID=UPI002ED638F6
MVPSGSKSTPAAAPTSTDGACQMIITFGGAEQTTGDHHRGHHHHPRWGFWHWFWVLLLLTLMVLFLLGCVKAVLGCCCTWIGKWKYDFLQPDVRYKDASRYRRFLINVIFFLVYPFVLCCRCFERLNEDDEDGNPRDYPGGGDDDRDRLLQQHGLLKGAMVVQKQVSPSVTSDTGTSVEGEHMPGYGRSRQRHLTEVATTDDDELDKLLQSEVQEGGTWGYNDNEEEDRDTRYVIDVMNRSQKALQSARHPRHSTKHGVRGHHPGSEASGRTINSK